jgi:hypothetical protein
MPDVDHRSGGHATKAILFFNDSDASTQSGSTDRRKNSGAGTANHHNIAFMYNRNFARNFENRLIHDGDLF